MKLTRLEIFGFKSFPQRTDIHFDEGITGIVGPNGSGKSNIADAVRWVLGEQSAKTLRGAKMEDVIFAGTQKRKQMPYCEVSLIFDNADGSLKSPHSEVMVTRRVYRSGEGEYSLNKKSCRLKDIVELFHDTGIGREGYSIIGQGHIDVILSGRGEERRTAFEDAAGIMGYRARKEEAERKLNRTQDHLVRVSDLLEELFTRLGPLKEQSEAARTYLALSARLKHLDANIYLSRHERLNKRIASLRESQQAIADLIKRHEQDIADLQQQRQASQAQLETAQADSERLGGLLQVEEESLREHAVIMERGAQVLLSAREELRKSLQTHEQMLEEQKELSLLQSGSHEDKEKHGALLTASEEKLEITQAQHDEAQTALLALEEELEAHRGLILQTVNSRSDARERTARQQAMLSQAQARLQELDGTQNQLTTALEQALEQKNQAEQNLQATTDAVNALRVKLNQTEAQWNAKKLALRAQQAQLNEAQERFQRDRARLSAMDDLAKAHEGYFQPVKQALSFAEGNKKVHGAVAQLIQVPKELETALEMVLGGALQNIVTDDEETAQELINYLREKRFGRTTFLPISAVRGRVLSPQERQVLNMPGCLGLASELIDYDSRYDGIMESLLGRTVVARDLDAAIAISRSGRQAFNVVTLQGDVMRSGGAMTGGSVQSRTVSLLGREREIKELSQSLNEQMDALQKSRASLKTEAEQAEQLEQALAQQRLVLQDEEIGIAREEERAARAREQVDQAALRLEQAEASKEQLTEMVRDLTSDLSKADLASRSIIDNQEQMEQAEKALRARQQEARDKAEALRLLLEQQRDARAQLAHQLDMLGRDQSRFDRELHQLAHRIEKLDSDMLSLKQRIQTETAKQEEMSLLSSQLKEKHEALRGQATQAEAIRREMTARQSQLTEQLEQAHQRFNEDNQKLHKGELSLTRLEEELHTMAATLWNTHELTYALAEQFRTDDKFELPAGEREAEDIRKQIKTMGAINIHALDEYAATQTRYDELSIQRDDAHQAREDLLSLIKRLQGQMEKQFLREFALINEYFAETFKRLFNGGQASLSLSDPSQPLDCEIQIKAQPPGKKLQLLSLLSGGERTLTAIAILFAMLKLKPTPFCVLDEIEAALDDANIYSFAEYLAEYARTTQFIVITHRKGTMEKCDMLYGVTMREKGVSDIISVNLQEYTA